MDLVGRVCDVSLNTKLITNQLRPQSQQMLPSHQGTRGHSSRGSLLSTKVRTVCKAKHHAECGCGKQPTGFCCSLHSLCLRWKKSFDKAQHSLTVETLQRAVKEGTFPDIIKAINDKPTANIILGETPKAFPPRSGAGQGWPLPPCLFQFPPITCFGGFM